MNKNEFSFNISKDGNLQFNDGSSYLCNTHFMTKNEIINLIRKKEEVKKAVEEVERSRNEFFKYLTEMQNIVGLRIHEQRKLRNKILSNELRKVAK